MTKKKALKIINSYLDLRNHNPWPTQPERQKEYLKYHEYKFDALEWLKAYYEDRTAATPEELLEVYLENRHNYWKDHRLISVQNFEWVRILYNWVYYKKIKGF